jgi:antitoxin ParD1/3/4
MHISLTEQQTEWVQDLINNGHYASTSEVLRHAIRLLQEESEAKKVKLLALREAVQKGIDEIEKGEFSNKNVDEIIALSKRRA